MAVIKPIKGSSSVFGDKRSRDRVKARIVSHTTTHNMDTFEQGEQDLGEYTSERWWDSKQVWRPIYDGTLRQYDIRHPDGSLWSQEDADRLCKEFPLTYPKDWDNPNDRGKRIERADIRTYGDAYFSHPDLIMHAHEGRLDLPDTPWGKALLAIASGNGGVKIDDGKNYRAGDARYYIENPEMDAQRADAQIDDALDAADLFRAMDEGEGDLERMADILVLFGVDITVAAGKTKLRKTLHPYVIDNVTTESGRTKQALFREYAKLPPDVLKTMAMVKRSIHRGYISSRAGSYMYKDSHVGSSFQEVVAYFRDIKNSQALDNLKAELKNDPS